MENEIVIIKAGQRFGRLTLVEKVTDTKISGHYHKWICACDCGNEKIVSKYRLADGEVKSCGCLKKEKAKEKKIDDRFFRAWSNMKSRCTEDKSSNSYKYYGAKGIEVCERWLDYKSFTVDMYDSYVEFEKINGTGKASLDRIDYDGNYEPSNCRWVDSKDQSANRSNSIKITIEDVEYETLTEVAKVFDISMGTLYSRYTKGKRGLDLVKKAKKQRKFSDTN